ncbi:MAG TPA: glycosyltransferase [Bacteroidales bacterium]|nr:glycosyltransferase [Bacteroidales bacterium]HPS16378.1 glycosyltransferase [Bacteroidales bacterium]
MKVAILANPNSIHTKRWIASLCQSGIEVVLIGLHKSNSAFYDNLPNFKSFTIGFKDHLNYIDNKIHKLKYITAVNRIKKIISFEKPDILHSYYASSYGLIGALCNFHPYVISVWGSDVFEFPGSSFFAKKVLKYNLSKSDHIMATSNALAQETKKYTSKKINVIPFGVDTEKFFKNVKKILFNENDIVIGTIKTLEKVYGIDYLIKAFAKLKEKNKGLSLKLLIVGSGSCEQEYKNLVKELGIKPDVIFTGYVDHCDIVKYYNNIDVFVVSSIRESFGVSVLEASACELPVVVTDTGGLPEVVEKNKTGMIVPVKDIDEIVNALELLISSEKLRIDMGESGRKHVIKSYDWSKNVQAMINMYKKTTKEK